MIMIDRILRDGGVSVPPDRFPGIGVYIKAGEVTAGNIEADTMALLEQIACRI
jgi:hypothetical protein